MNDAHLHMVVNHFPIIGMIFGLGILITGIFLKNSSVKNVAYCLFIIAAIFAYASMATGEGAEEIVEELTNIGDKIIHDHEEMAEKFAVVAYLLGLVSIAGLFTTIKRKYSAKLVSFIAVTVAVVGVILAKETGTTGGEIRHTEIRANATANATQNDVNAENQEEAED